MVQSLGSRTQGLGSRVQGSGCHHPRRIKVHCLDERDCDAPVSGFGVWVRVSGFGFQVSGFGVSLQRYQF